MILRPEPLSASSFRPFGEVLEATGRDFRWINGGLTRKYEQLSLARVDPEGTLQLCLYRSRPVELPFHLRELERHPLASQAFMPLHDRPFPVIVATGDPEPSVAALRVFMTDGHQGVNLAPGVWHHHQLSLEEESDYLVLERADAGGNLETWTIDGEAILAL